MDNLTHTLIGIAAAETLIAARRGGQEASSSRDRVRLWLASALANNLPDLDVAYTWGGDRLDYLLHHRGHTHTLLLAPLQGAVLLGILWLFWRRKQDVPWKGVIGLCLLGPLLHVLADSWNTYGVHPYWPVNNEWYYGDLVFIIEPWLWVALLPAIWKRASSLWGKALALLPLGFVIYLGWTHPFVQPLPALAFTLGTLAWILAQRSIHSQRARLAGSLLICTLALGFFGWAQARIRPAFAGEGSEVVVMSHPANPFCATVFTAGFRGETYRASLWTAAAFPSLVPVAMCRRFSEPETSVPLREIAGATPTAVRDPVGEFIAPKAELERIAADCRGRGFLRFARVPFWFNVDGAAYLGDLRFARGRSRSFAELPLAGECPRSEPPWVGRFLPES